MALESMETRVRRNNDGKRDREIAARSAHLAFLRYEYAPDFQTAQMRHAADLLSIVCWDRVG
jgi:hypothetical protein